jgi:hypothetical protein
MTNVGRRMGAAHGRSRDRHLSSLAVVGNCNGLYAAAAVQADDADGAEHDLVTQHDDVRRDDLAAVVDLAPAGGTNETSLEPRP